MPQLRHPVPLINSGGPNISTTRRYLCMGWLNGIYGRVKGERQAVISSCIYGGRSYDFLNLFASDSITLSKKCNNRVPTVVGGWLIGRLATRQFLCLSYMMMAEKDHRVPSQTRWMMEGCFLASHRSIVPPPSRPAQSAMVLLGYHTIIIAEQVVRARYAITGICYIKPVPCVRYVYQKANYLPYCRLDYFKI